jgi:hypothetical protein
LSYPGYRDDLLLRDPQLAPMLGAHDVLQLPADANIEYDFELPDAWVAPSHVISAEGADLDEPQTRRFAAWMALLDAHRACRMSSDQPVIDAAFARARALIGEPPELRDCRSLMSSLSL